MRLKLTLVLAVLAAAVLGFLVLRDPYASRIASGDLAGLRALALGQAAEKEAALGLAGALGDADYRRALAAHEVLRVTGDEAVKATLAQEDGPAFLRAFLGDTAWMEAYLGTGFEPKPAGLDVLRRLHALEPGAKPHARELMAAIAITYTASNYAEELTRMAGAPRFRSTPEGRFRFYREAQEAGRLHRMFGALRAWELTFVVSSRTDEEALEWMHANLNVPLARLTDACWAVRYQGASAFGESIQGPLFYVPGRDHLNWAEGVFYQGGVCGSLSHFGAVAARARGVPSYTCGQPGHCAYAVRHARGKWVGGFGGPDGSPHFSPWGWNYSHVLALEAAFADDAKAAAAKRHLWQARLPGDTKRRLEALALATAAVPAFIPAWNERVDAMLAAETSGETWLRTYRELLASFGELAFPAGQVLAKFEGKLIEGADADRRMRLALEFQEAAGKGLRSWSWDMPSDIVARHSKWFEPRDRARYFNRTLALHADNRHFFGQLSAWGTKHLGKASDGTPLFTLALAEVVKLKAATLGDEALKEVTKTAILAAESARSAEAFRVAAAAGAKFATNGGEPRGDLSGPGRLVSDKAVPWLSTTSGWDQPWSHLGVLNGQGGQFHTEREKEPSITVQLPDGVLLASVVVEKTRGNEHRLRRAKIQVSTDGATWFDAAETASCPDIWKVTFADREVRARWVRLVALNEGNGDYLHLRSFLVRAR
jgi:hypothetical protein